MARLSAFKVNSKAIETGDWVRPGDEYDDLEIQTRGFTDAYTDARAAKTRRAALQYGGDASKIPNAIARGIMVDCLVDHVVLDVRNLVDETGQPVPRAQFFDMLRSPDYADLVTACVRAAAQVGHVRGSEAAEAVPSSVTPSA